MQAAKPCLCTSACRHFQKLHCTILLCALDTDSLEVHKPYLEERAELADEAEMLVHLRTGHLSEDITEAHSKPCFVFWFNSHNLICFLFLKLFY